MKAEEMKAALNAAKYGIKKVNAAEKAAEVEAKKNERPDILELSVIDYSEKSIAVVGDTKWIANELKELNGKYCGRLTIDGQTVQGWVFSKKYADVIIEFVKVVTK